MRLPRPPPSAHLALGQLVVPARLARDPVLALGTLGDDLQGGGDRSLPLLPVVPCPLFQSIEHSGHPLGQPLNSGAQSALHTHNH